MSSDTILTAPDGTRYSLDNLATQKWLDGHVPGAEVIAGYLRGQAAEKFTAGRDGEAMLLRQLADHIRDKIIPAMEERAETNKLDHPYELGASKKRTNNKTCRG